MINHAADVNSKRSDERIEWNKVKDDVKQKKQEEQDKRDPYITLRDGTKKRMSECNSTEIASQFAGF